MAKTEKKYRLTLKQAVAFAILMQNGQGIMTKAPSYVEEKLDYCADLTDPRQALDSRNQAIFNAWHEFWTKPNVQTTEVTNGD